MKFFVVGLHCSGKQTIFENLTNMGINCGRLFSNVNINDCRYDFYSDKDIYSIFENKAYVFIKELDEYKQNTFEGLSFYEYDNNDVFFISPDQFNAIPAQIITSNELCVIWLDNNRPNRWERYIDERRSYDFNKRDEAEKRNIDDFIKTIYNTKTIHTLYFTNEDENRVSAIVYTLVKHNDLIPIFEKNFN